MPVINELFSIKDKRALVTGSSRGIGREIAMVLAAAGATVYVHGKSADSNLQDTVAEINANNGKAYAAVADLADPQKVQDMLDGVLSEGTIDILVLNASVQSYQLIEEFTAEELRWQVEVNMRSSFDLIKAVLPGMKDNKWGRLLAIGSVNQFKPSPRLALYASLKGALSNLMLNCARQYAADGITANTLAPGVIVTDRNREVLADEEFTQNILRQIPVNRLGDVKDCAGTALLLCSNAGSYITGSDIPVAGGMQL